jgi:integrase
VIRFHMPRQKYQRPEVYATGTREKLWKVEYREYFIGADGKQQSRHKSASWSRTTHTKGQAQVKADKLLQELSAGPTKADGTMTLGDFWTRVYLPIRKRAWTGHTEVNAIALWKNHIEPKLGTKPLNDISKVTLQLHLASVVDAGFGEVVVEAVRSRLSSMLEEAVDNEYIVKNPARKVEAPQDAKPSKETRSLTEAEVHKLFDGTTGRDRMLWRILLLTGARIGEVLALTRDDVRPDGLMIDETVVHSAVHLPGGGALKLPKGNKLRLAVLPASLRAELEAWLTTHTSNLVFPSSTGTLYRRSSKEIQAIVTRGREVGIPDLQYRMCRTTFASLFEGDEADRTSIMGHHSTKFTLERYRKPVQDRRQQAVENLDKRFQKVVEITKKVG